MHVSLGVSASRVVRLRPEIYLYFSLPSGQLFELEYNTVWFAGDYVLVEHANQERFARAGRGVFETAHGQLSPAECRLLARAIPLHYK